MVYQATTPNRRSRPTSITVIGGGGLTGSHCLDHFGRMDLSRITIVDKGIYEHKNLHSQSICPADVGKAKATVQARRLRRIAPRLTVQAIVAAVEDVPLGRLAADVVVLCVDSRIARQYGNQVSWRLDAACLDLAVQADGLLSRVNVYHPGGAAACLECAWGPDDYEALELEYPCHAGALDAPSTNAPSGLGGVAAAMAAVEVQKMLEGNWSDVLLERQHLVDLKHHTHLLTRLCRNRACRFDHTIWDIQHVASPPHRISLEELFGQVGLSATAPTAAVSVASQPFATRLFCARCCQAGTELFCLTRRISQRRVRCPNCDGRRIVRGIDQRDWLELSQLSRRQRRASLRRFGIVAGDVMSLAAGGSIRHVEIGVGLSGQQHRVREVHGRQPNE